LGSRLELTYGLGRRSHFLQLRSDVGYAVTTIRVARAGRAS